MSVRSEQEARVSRRDLAALLPPLAALRQPEYQWRSDIHERFPFKERGEAPEEGDVVSVGNMYYLLLNGKRYEMSRDRFELYRWRSKFDEYGGRVFSFAPNMLPQNIASLPLTEPPKPPDPKLNMVFDKFTTDPKEAKLFGGEIIVFIPGLFTDEQKLFETPGQVNDLFRTLRKDSGLAALGWREEDMFYFTYGAEGPLEVASAKDTAENPRQTFEKAMAFIAWIKENFLFARINLVGHSLGAVIALEIAKKHYNSINNLVLVSGPVRGLRRTLENRIATPIMKSWVRAQGIDERVSDYLFELGNDPFHQRGLDLFAQRFVAMEKRILEYAVSADRIVPVESALLRKKAKIVKGKIIPPIWYYIEKWYDYLLDLATNHWAALSDEEFVEEVTYEIGENRAAA